MPAITNLVVLLSAAATVFGTTHQARVNHGSIARRMENEARSENDSHILSKRFYSPRVTWYPTNTGADACTGRNHGDYDNIVALNIPQWGNLNSRSSHCGKKIRIHANGRTEIGIIQDACGTCYHEGEIDLTRGLFEKFYPLGKGVFEATWEFVDGNDGGDDDDDDDDKPPVKKPIKHSTPKPTKHVEEKPAKPKTTSTPAKKKTSSKASSSTKKSSSSASASSTPVIPPPPAPTPPTEDTDSDVGNAGADPSADSSLSGGISSGPGNGAAGLTFNKFVAGAAALILAIHAL